LVSAGRAPRILFNALSISSGDPYILNTVGEY
jgi:hypothetical protein